MRFFIYRHPETLMNLLTVFNLLCFSCLAEEDVLAPRYSLESGRSLTEVREEYNPDSLPILLFQGVSEISKEEQFPRGIESISNSSVNPRLLKDIHELANGEGINFSELLRELLHASISFDPRTKEIATEVGRLIQEGDIKKARNLLEIITTSGFLSSATAFYFLDWILALIHSKEGDLARASQKWFALERHYNPVTTPYLLNKISQVMLGKTLLLLGKQESASLAFSRFVKEIPPETANRTLERLKEQSEPSEMLLNFFHQLVQVSEAEKAKRSFLARNKAMEIPEYSVHSDDFSKKEALINKVTQILRLLEAGVDISVILSIDPLALAEAAIDFPPEQLDSLAWGFPDINFRIRAKEWIRDAKGKRGEDWKEKIITALKLASQAGISIVEQRPSHGYDLIASWPETLVWQEIENLQSPFEKMYYLELAAAEQTRMVYELQNHLSWEEFAKLPACVRLHYHSDSMQNEIAMIYISGAVFLFLKRSGEIQSAIDLLQDVLAREIIWYSSAQAPVVRLIGELHTSLRRYPEAEVNFQEVQTYSRLRTSSELIYYYRNPFNLAFLALANRHWEKAKFHLMSIIQQVPSPGQKQELMSLLQRAFRRFEYNGPIYPLIEDNRLGDIKKRNWSLKKLIQRFSKRLPRPDKNRERLLLEHSI